MDPDNPFAVGLRTTTDGEGRFEIDGLVAGRYEGGRITGAGRGYYNPAVIVDTTFDIAAGEERDICLGGTGRPIEGRAVVQGDLVTSIDWTEGYYRLAESPPIAMSSYPIRGAFDTEREFTAARQRLLRELKAYSDTEAGQHFSPREYPLQMGTDGKFRTGGTIPPGHYLVSLQPGTGRYAGGAPVAEGAVVFEIPPISGGYTQEPLDLGEVPVYLIPTLRVGMQAPDFEVEDAEGNTVRLSEYRGKLLLLDFWAIWCGPCVAELPYVRDAYEAFKDRSDFAMMSISLDENWDTIERFRKRTRMPWRQCRAGPFGTSQVLREYGVHGIPESFLISPQGVVLERGLRGNDVYRAIRSHLPTSAQGASPQEEETSNGETAHHSAFTSKSAD